jgi:hypothetical protein
MIGGGDQEVAAGPAIFPGRRTFGLVEFLKHPPTGRNESAAGIGQQRFAVGPDHEPRAQTRLKLGDQGFQKDSAAASPPRT